jgi:hypothetical protein
MRSTDEAVGVASVLPDLRDVPLTRLPDYITIWHEAALARVLPPDSSVPRLRVAAFTSHIS